MNTSEFEIFYSTYQEYVHIRICTMLYYRPDLIDDAIQEVWIKLWRGLEELEHEQNIRGWVKVVVKRAALDFIRSQKTYESHINSLEQFIEWMDIEEFDLVDFQEPSSEEIVLEDEQEHEQRERLDRVIDRLPLQHRLFLTLYRTDLPYTILHNGKISKIKRKYWKHNAIASARRTARIL